MRIRPVLTVVGVLMTLVGLLWIGQGLGTVTWPTSSFMIGERTWVNHGSALAAAGLLVLLLARRLPRQ